MMTENSYYNWNVKSGDYHRANADYDALYVKGKKRDKVIRAFLWGAIALVTSQVFMKILAYAASK